MKIIFGESAFRRSEALIIIVNNSDILRQELFKALVFYKSRALHHWCAEISAYLLNISRHTTLKKKVKLKHAQLYDVMFYGSFQTHGGVSQAEYLKGAINIAIETEKQKDITSLPSLPALTQNTEESVLNQLYEELGRIYHEWVAGCLDENTPSVSEIKDEITGLMESLL